MFVTYGTTSTPTTTTTTTITISKRKSTKIVPATIFTPRKFLMLIKQRARSQIALSSSLSPSYASNRDEGNSKIDAMHTYRQWCATTTQYFSCLFRFAVCCYFPTCNALIGNHFNFINACTTIENELLLFSFSLLRHTDWKCDWHQPMWSDRGEPSNFSLSVFLFRFAALFLFCKN